MTPLIFGLFGLIVGSFLNVIILRHGERGIGGRSACMSCGTQLRWYDMVPVLSWIFLRGACRACGKSISIQYPLVEALTGVLFAIIGAAEIPSLFPFDMQLLGCAIIALFIAIAVYDIRHTIIPDVWVWPLSGLCLLWSLLLLSHSFDVESVLMLLIAGPIAALPLFTLWFVSRGRWMGFGDVKLALGMGWLLGFPFGFAAVFWAFIIGAVVSVGILLPLPRIIRFFARHGITTLEDTSAPLTMKSEVPFGPFLIISCLMIWFALLYHVPIPLFSYYG